MTGLLIWSASSVAMAVTSAPVPFTHGARTNYTEYSSGCGIAGSNVCSGPSNFVSNGGAWFTDSSSVNVDSSAQAYATLDATDGTPILKAYGNAPAFGARWSGAQGVQRYQYTGSLAATITVTANFHSNMSGTGSGLRGSVGLFDVSAWGVESSLEFAFDDGNVSGYLGEGLPYSSYESDSIFNATGDQNFSLTTTLDLNNGDEFFLYGAMSAYGTNGGLSDGLSTGTFSFDNNNLQILGSVSAVPVPAALYLFSPALLGLLGLRRKS